jgi:undecaprenyl-phosphate 4-deoxy-4-formamido-L-arabinose transferase
VSVVIPAYRSPGTLEALCSGLVEAVGPLGDELEIVLVDDGSGDTTTWPEIERLAAALPAVRGVQLLRNYGQHNALLAGLREARHSVIVTMDDDLQHPPAEVPRLLAALTDDVDVVYGRPREEQQRAYRNVSSRLAKSAMARVLGPDVYPRSSAFRAFRGELVAASAEVRDPNLSIDVLLSWASNRIIDIEIDLRPRAGGVSGYTPRMLVKHALDMATGYSIRPLRWVSALGLVFALLGFAMLAFVLLRYVFGDADVAGFTFLAASLTLFAGAQLVSLGMIGEYVGRIHLRSMGRPQYLVRTTTDAPDDV